MTKKSANYLERHRNVENYYYNKGVSIVAAKFEEWIDKDKSGILPRRIIPVTDLNFEDQYDVESAQLIISNTYEVTGLEKDIHAFASISSGAEIIVNDSLIDGQFTTVKEGDLVKIRTESGKFGESKEFDINIGENIQTWKIKTRLPKIMVKTLNGTHSWPNSGIPGDDPPVSG